MARYIVLNGPDRMSMMFSVFGAEELVEFTLQGRGKIQATLSGVTRKDAYHQSHMGPVTSFKIEGRNIDDCRFEGEFSTKTRKGWIEFED